MSTDNLVDLRSLNEQRLREFLQGLGEPDFRAAQIFRWIHRFGVVDFDQMTNLSKSLRSALQQQATLAPLRLDTLYESAESTDNTKKARYLCVDGAAIESVLIPRESKRTVCISTQVGCALGCTFCATATLGLTRNLTSGEIVDQVYRIQQHSEKRITNIVFMGMGEPLANLDNTVVAVENLCNAEGLDFSPRKITISTVGLVPKLAALGKRLPRVGLAVSLHATDNATRDMLVPINKRWPIETLTQALRNYPLPRRQRITIEYTLLPGINDRAVDIRNLPRLLDGIRTKINLLPYNPGATSDARFRRPTPEQLDAFAERLREKNLTVTVRQSRGLDIAGACGQLAARAPTEH